ncbi:hypothetical protein [Burkholderia anthina]|uniref:hypothetical protein n=1 Tax=Burkholderia anthina TaxID=179879 RepID=UPI00158ADB08|nr:hypothetical protein [Burkholderia anthina]
MLIGAQAIALIELFFEYWSREEMIASATCFALGLILFNGPVTPLGRSELDQRRVGTMSAIGELDVTAPDTRRLLHRHVRARRPRVLIDEGRLAMLRSEYFMFPIAHEECSPLNRKMGNRTRSCERWPPGAHCAGITVAAPTHLTRIRVEITPKKRNRTDSK